jgi:DNA-binding transcriptional LysR family regulator
VTGHLRLGCSGTVGRWRVPHVLEQITRDHPKVHVVVVDATTTSLVPQLRTDALDLAVVNLPLTDAELAADPLFDEDRLVVAPDGHPLAGRARVTLKELAEHDLLLEPVGTAFRDELDREAASAGVTLRAKAEVDGLRLIATLAFQGFGAAVIPATAAPRWLEGQWQRVAVAGLARRSVGLARRRRGLLSAPARALQDTIVDVVHREAHTMEGVHPDAGATGS